MRTKENIIDSQRDFIAGLKDNIDDFMSHVDKSEIETILLSGSIARGDYFPGEMGGMVDLIVMKKSGSSCTAESVFGKDLEPEIPFHCVKYNEIWYEILFTDCITLDLFMDMEEARKFSILESQILYDPDDSFKDELKIIYPFVRKDLQAKLNDSLGYIYYLLSGYKKDRWYRREAFIQMHENLTTAIRAGIRCLFYINGFYAPADDRAIYYSHSLPDVPKEYGQLMNQILSVTPDSEDDYFRRESIFLEKFVRFIEEKVH